MPAGCTGTSGWSAAACRCGGRCPGPSGGPERNRLAGHTEDHLLDYAAFEGEIRPTRR